MKSLLLYLGVRPGGCENWNRAFVERLRTLALSPAQRARLDGLLSEIAFHEAETDRYARELSALDAGRQTELSILESHPGVGPVVARAFLAELFQFRRFASAAEVAAYVGLAPCARQSGETRRGTGRLPGGKPQLRAKLVEAAWAWMRTSAEGRAIYRRHLGKTGSAKKAVVAMGRKLVVRLWTMLTNGELWRGEPLAAA